MKTKGTQAAKRRQRAPRVRAHVVDDLQSYSVGDVLRLFGVPAPLLRALTKARLLSPAEGPETEYTFADGLVLRLAGALKTVRLSDAQITRAIGAIRRSLAPNSVLASLALQQLAEPTVDVTEGAVWSATPGVAGEVATVGGWIAESDSRRLQADQHFARAHALEESDLAAARAAYLEALNSHTDHLEARINLGRLLHLSGDLADAEKVYRQARSSSALLSYNLAILLEDLGREEEAVAAYREALAQDPTLHDAHFNLSRLHDKAQRTQDAFRHLLAYRRHVRRLEG